MRYIFLTFCLLSGCINVKGNYQDTIPKSIKRYIGPGILMFVAGAADGFMDYLQFHYDGNNSFLQPDISWKNKWKNGDPSQGERFFLSSTLLVWTTDAWHASKFIRNGCITSAIVLNIGEKRKWHQYIKDVFIYSIINRAGFTLTYNIIFK